ncbi:uncharacterized protein LOC142333442 [Lycorma delicatula]|uniref:uncharacterized protein LOC142333442 n=1 Tax=Lycorma delicatula TaxID=130591 RepID=UPI003F518590
MCICIYTLVQVADTSLKVQNISISISAILDLFLCYNQAQNIINMSDELRFSIYKCSWTDKPLWFKKSLTIIETCANRELSINPFGVYTMNRSNFAKIINLSYSYYNVMSSFKKSSK